MKMNIEELKLWNNIRDFELDEQEDTFMFSDRLARENGWPKQLTTRAMDEYKKFMFLVCVTHQALTPSEKVDQVWHLHLLYTRSYWKHFCTEVLKREIHHSPTRGGPKEKDKFNNWYAKTLFHYREKFDSPPPLDIWPSPNLKSRPSNFRYIDLTKNWIIKKPI